MNNQLLNQTEWYTLTETENGSLLLEFKINKSEHDFDILSAQPLPHNKICMKKQILITGQGPIWFYCHATAWATAGCPRSISISGPNIPPSIPQLQIYPLESLVSNHKWMNISNENDLVKIEFLKTENNQKWPTKILGDIPQKKQFYHNKKRILITGRGSNWMYAGCVAFAIKHGIQEVLYHSPESINEDYQIWPTPNKVSCTTNKSLKSGVRIGIVGDPNSGKSIFSRLLLNACLNLNIDVWRFDGDAASPTQDWYFYMIETDRKDEAECMRKKGKKQWNKELEQQITKRLQSLKQGFEILIVDLPGGNHKVETPQRIPQGREIIMNEIDAFIIIDRPDIQSGIYWQRELALHGLENRIIATISSTKPNEIPSLILDPLVNNQQITGTITGLDRKCDTSKGTEALHSFATILKQIYIQ